MPPPAGLGPPPAPDHARLPDVPRPDRPRDQCPRPPHHPAEPQWADPHPYPLPRRGHGAHHDDHRLGSPDATTASAAPVTTTTSATSAASVTTTTSATTTTSSAPTPTTTTTAPATTPRPPRRPPPPRPARLRRVVGWWWGSARTWRVGVGRAPRPYWIEVTSRRTPSGCVRSSAGTRSSLRPASLTSPTTTTSCCWPPSPAMHVLPVLYDTPSWDGAPAARSLLTPPPTLNTSLP